MVVTSGLKTGERVVSVGAASLRSETLKGQSQTGEEGEKRPLEIRSSVPQALLYNLI